MSAQITKITVYYESRDDKLQGESNSIVNQKAFFEECTKRKRPLNAWVLSPDRRIGGRTIATIIVKDMSWFRCNDLKVGLYTDKDKQNDNDFTPLLNIMNK